jgi:hypothetical protein
MTGKALPLKSEVNSRKREFCERRMNVMLEAAAF